MSGGKGISKYIVPIIISTLPNLKCRHVTEYCNSFALTPTIDISWNVATRTPVARANIIKITEGSCQIVKTAQ